MARGALPETLKLADMGTIEHGLTGGATARAWRLSGELGGRHGGGGSGGDAGRPAGAVGVYERMRGEVGGVEEEGRRVAGVDGLERGRRGGGVS